MATGQNDDSYKGGVKEDTTCPDETTGSIPNNKSDLLTFHVYTEAATAASNSGFLNIAWSRVNDPSGTTLMDFEFNLSNEGCLVGPNKVRSVGDLLIEYSIDQGGSRADITGRTWTGSAWGNPVDLDVPSAVCGGNPCAAGTINSSPIPAAESDGLISTGSLAPRTFGEAQIDLRLLLQEDPCVGFGSAMLKSRSSDSFTSQLKDFIRPQDIEISNCGALAILKNSTKGGPVSQAGAVFSYDSSSVTDNGTGDEDPDVGQVCVSGLVPGDYDVTETSAPPGYGLPTDPGPETVTVVNGTNCTDNPPTGTAVVTFTDPPLADIQVNFRDGGSGETSATSITCANTGTTPDTTPATGWDDSVTHEDIRIDPSPRTVTCEIVIDPSPRTVTCEIVIDP